MAFESITEIELDISRPGIAIPVRAKQYDTARKIKARLFDNGVAWSVPTSNCLAVVGYRKSDNIGGYYDHAEDGTLAVSIDGVNTNVATIIIDRNVLTTAGNVDAEVTFYDAATHARISTFGFVVNVEAAAITELDIASQPYFNILAEDIARVLDAEIGAVSLKSLTDTSIGTPTNGQVLTYNGSKWVNRAPSGGGSGGATSLGELTDTNIAVSPSNGQVLTYNDGVWKNIDPPSGGGSSTLRGLMDTDIDQIPSNGQVLTYDGGHWINKSPESVSTSLRDLSDTDIVNVTNGQYLKYNGTKWLPADPPSGGGSGGEVTPLRTSYQYATTSYYSEPPTSGWSDTPNPTMGQYLWSKATTTWSNDSLTTVYSVSYVGQNGTNGEPGANGETITPNPITVYYANGSSPTVQPPASSWKAYADPQPGTYQWTRLLFSWSDGSETTVYTVSYSGTNGSDGSGGGGGASSLRELDDTSIEASPSIGDVLTYSSSGNWVNSPQTIVYPNSVTNVYCNSDSGTQRPVEPTGGWSPNPNPVKGKYLWTQTITSWSTGVNTASYTVTYIGQDGSGGGGSSAIVLDDVTDVSISNTVTDGQVLTYSNGFWVNDSVGPAEDSKDTFYASTTTAAATASKSITVSNFTPKVGTILVVTFTKGSTSSTITLNINNSGVSNTVSYNNSSIIADAVPIRANDAVTLICTSVNAEQSTNSWRILSVTNVDNPPTPSIEALSNTSISDLANGQALIYDGTNWINGTISGGGDKKDTYFTSCNTSANTSAKDLSNSVISSLTPELGMIIAIQFWQGSTSSEITFPMNGVTQTVRYNGYSTGINNYVTINSMDIVTLVCTTQNSSQRYWGIVSVSSGSNAGGSGATTLSALTDTSINTTTPLANGQYLKYNGSTWINAAAPSGSGATTLEGLSNVTLNTVQGGQALVYDQTNSVWTNRTISSGSGSSVVYNGPWYLDTNGNVAFGTGSNGIAKIQNAIDNCPVHGTVHIPWLGTSYTGSSSANTTDTIHIAKPITLESDYTGYEAYEMIGYGSNYSKVSNYNSAITKIDNATMKRPLIVSKSTVGGISIHCLGVTLKNISIQDDYITDALSPNKSVIRVADDFGFTSSGASDFDRYITIDHCTAISFGVGPSSGTYSGYGMYFESTGLTRILNSQVYGSHNAFYVTRANTNNTSIVFQNCWAINFTNIGYNLYDCDYCSFISCAADSTAGSQSATKVGYWWENCSAVSAIGCGAEKMTEGVHLKNCENVSFGGLILLTKSGTSSIPVVGVRAEHTTSGTLYCLENLKIEYLSSGYTNIYKVIQPSGSKVTLINTNVDKVYNGNSYQNATNGGMFDFISS